MSPQGFELVGLGLSSDSTFEIRVRFGFDFSGFDTALVVCFLNIFNVCIAFNYFKRVVVVVVVVSADDSAKIKSLANFSYLRTVCNLRL